MIILEGADGTGKTTLAESLARALGVPVVHSPGPKEEWLSSVFNYHTAQPGAVVVYDRFYFSELVYGPLLRDGVAIPLWFTEYAEKVWFPTVQPLVVFCDAPLDKVAKTVSTRGEMKGVPENIADILSKYREVMNDMRWRSNLDFVDYDFSKESKADILTHILNWADSRQRYRR